MSHQEYAASLNFSKKVVASLQHVLFTQFCAMKHKHSSDVCAQDTSLAKPAVQAARKYCMHAELACNLNSVPPMDNNKPVAYRAAEVIVVCICAVTS